MSRIFLSFLFLIFICTRSIAGGAPYGLAQFIDLDGRMASSDCIGNPVTPTCAAETLFACSLWDDENLCRLVGVEPHVSDSKAKHKRVRIEYAIVSEHTLSEQDIDPALAWADWHKVGYADVGVAERTVHADRSVLPPVGWDTFFYVFRPVGSHWHYVTSGLVGHEAFTEQ